MLGPRGPGEHLLLGPRRPLQAIRTSFPIAEVEALKTQAFTADF